MLPPFPEVLAPTFIGFALSAALFHGVRLIAKPAKDECERHTGFWRMPQATAEQAPVEICIVSP